MDEGCSQHRKETPPSMLKAIHTDILPDAKNAERNTTGMGIRKRMNDYIKSIWDNPTN